MTRDLALLVTGFLLVALESAIGSVSRLGALMPNALLPLVIYLGVTHDISLARGSMLAFALGTLVDAAAGHALGLMTFVHVLTFLAARGAAFQLALRGRTSQVLVTFLAASLGSLIALSLLRMFRPDEHFEQATLRHTLRAVLGPSLATAAIAPLMFRLARRIDSLRRREEGAGLA